MDGLLIAADIGATHARVGAFTDVRSSRPVKHQVFPVSRRYRADLEQLVEAVNGVAGSRKVARLTMAVAGAVDPDGRKIVASGNLTDWAGKALAADLSLQLGCDVKIVNDAEASARGEAILQSKPEPFWHIIWGTGVGGGLVTFEGTNPVVTPGEVGHQILDPHDGLEPDGCGQPGCLESFAGGAGIERRYGRPAAKLTQSQWAEVCGSMAQGVYNLAVSRPTKHVVFAGGIALNQKVKVKEVERLVAKKLKMFPAPKLRVTAHGEQAALIGALAAE